MSGLQFQFCIVAARLQPFSQFRLTACLQVRHKAGLDRRMAELEEAIKLFSQKKVLIQVRVAV